MIKIMSGAVFTDNPKQYITDLNCLNQLSETTKVTEVYGSLRSEHISLPSARPDHRLRNVNRDYLREYVRLCKEVGIKFNYTMNAPINDSITTINENIPTWISELKWLQEIGVKRVTVSSSFLMQLVCEHTDLEIEVSTIKNITQPSALTKLKELYPNITKVCLGIDINRNIGMVRKMVKVGKRNSVDVEILATEMCKVGSTNCSQLFRNECYSQHANNQTEQETKCSEIDSVVRGFPQSNKLGCIASRTKDENSWLVSNIIPPNDLQKYVERTKCEHIKVSNRTAVPHFAIALVGYYIRGGYNGHLAGLWQPLQLSNFHAAKKPNYTFLHNKISQKVPFMCSELSKPRTFEYLWFGTKIKRYGNFMSIFFEREEIDWSFIEWGIDTNYIEVWKNLIK